MFSFFKKKSPVDPARQDQDASAEAVSEQSVTHKVDWVALGELPSVQVPEPSSEDMSGLVPQGADSLVAAPTQKASVISAKSAPEPVSVATPSPLRKALAILPYNNLDYFSRVFESILSQTVFGDEVRKHFEIFVFQDALQARHESTRQQYEAIGRLAVERLGQDHFFRRQNNVGIAFQFDLAERTLFEERGYDFVVLFEHDLVIAPGYLEILAKLAEKFRDDDRVAAVSSHSEGYRLSQEEQERRKQEYVVMGHDWGAGVFRRAWKKRVPIMAGYYKLLEGMPFEARNNLMIHAWMKSMGFTQGSTSQDTIKACVDSALHQVRISTLPNLGLYIGVEGMHWNEEIYASMGYDKTVLYTGAYGEPADLTQERFNLIFEQQAQAFLAAGKDFDFAAFAAKVAKGDVFLNVLANSVSANVTREDVVAAYKLFLQRMPENMDVITPRLGLPPLRLLAGFLLADEFLNRPDIQPLVVEAAKRVLKRQQAAPKPE